MSKLQIGEETATSRLLVTIWQMQKMGPPTCQMASEGYSDVFDRICQSVTWPVHSDAASLPPVRGPLLRLPDGTPPQSGPPVTLGHVSDAHLSLPGRALEPPGCRTSSGGCCVGEPDGPSGHGKRERE